MNLWTCLFTRNQQAIPSEHNRKTKAIAENIKAKRILEVQDDNFNLVTGFKSQMSFLGYFKSQAESRKSNEGNNGNWCSAYRLFSRLISDARDEWPYAIENETGVAYPLH